MNRQFLDYYNSELHYLRKSAGDFAREYPKIAGRLSLDTSGREICPDPFVERLLEGVAFLGARIRLKLDAEFPRVTQGILESVFPHFLTPIPSMTIVRFDPEADVPPEGLPIPAGHRLRNIPQGADIQTACTFRTAHEVRLFALEWNEVRYFSRELAEVRLPANVPARAALRFRIRHMGDGDIGGLGVDSLPVYFGGSDDLPSRILEQLFRHADRVILQSVGSGRPKQLANLPASTIRWPGFEEEEALLPPCPRTFEGYRLLQEYFALPQRFHFAEFTGLAEGWSEATGQEIDLIVTFREAERALESRIDESAFSLFCSPAINLFPKQLDNVDLNERQSEFLLVPDHTRPFDFEVFDVEEVTVAGEGHVDEIEVKPAYWTQDGSHDDGIHYTLSRATRLLTEKEKRLEKKVDYLGCDVHLSLGQHSESSLDDLLKGGAKLRVRAQCTNRHLPCWMSPGTQSTDFDISVPAVAGIHCLMKPSEPIPSRAQGSMAWEIISHLSLNYISLVDQGEDGATALREMLSLYAVPGDLDQVKQIRGVRSLSSRPVVGRSPGVGPISFVRGLEVKLDFDEANFEGSGIFVLGRVLSHFLSKHVTVNSFVETVIASKQRKEIIRWPSLEGRRPVM